MYRTISYPALDLIDSMVGSENIRSLTAIIPENGSTVSMDVAPADSMTSGRSFPALAKLHCLECTTSDVPASANISVDSSASDRQEYNTFSDNSYTAHRIQTRF